MTQASTQKNVSSLSERLNQKIEEDQQKILDLTERKLAKLAEDSTRSLRDSVNITVRDMESRLKALRKQTLLLTSISMILLILLVIAVISGLGIYTKWRLREVKALQAKESSIKAELQSLPPEFVVFKNRGGWYLAARKISYRHLAATVKGKREDVVKLG